MPIIRAFTGPIFLLLPLYPSVSRFNPPVNIKAKPTQRSVAELRSIGITPDMIVARSDMAIKEGLREKIAQFCDVEKRGVIPMATAPILYEIPLLFEKENVAEYLMERLNLQPRSKPDWSVWETAVAETKRKKPKVSIALAGKYVELHDAYIRVREALKHAALFLGLELDLKWVHSTDLEKARTADELDKVSGIIVPGGFGSRGIEGKIMAARYARSHNIPYLGLCLGMQLMVVEFARYIFQNERANSTEFDQSTPYPVIDLMPDQQNITDMGGTMRLGLYPCVLQPGTIAQHAYNTEQVEERHRHRFEFNNQFRSRFQEHGMKFSGLSPDGKLVEIAELENHPFMVGTQFHPEADSASALDLRIFEEFIAGITAELLELNLLADAA